jgi:Fic family protein
MIQELEQFMLESNRIENEPGLNPCDLEVAQNIYNNGFQELKDILVAHQNLTKHLNIDWSGKWRICNVRAGNYLAPDWSQVPELMAQYWKQFPNMDSWTAHNEYQKIHSFQDFNGRIGRLIWLSKAIKEDYDFQRSFLHHYYYQSLRHYHG